MNYASRLLCSAVAVGTAWSTGVVRVIPPLLHGYADVTVTVALILLPFILGFDNSTAIQSSAGAAIARSCSSLCGDAAVGSSLLPSLRSTPAPTSPDATSH